MAITYFNWNELLVLSRKDPAAIICLVYAQLKEYNELSDRVMREKLNLHHFPNSLFSDRLFIKHKHSLECRYKTKDPQSYFYNSSFLTTAASAMYKVEYLKVLSLRKPSSRNNWIPETYYSRNQYNPFFNREDGKIVFYLEPSV